MPRWAPLLVPLLCTASVLELILASGVTSGGGLVLLVPLIWSVPFHRRWESACVVVAVVTVQAVSSVVRSTPGDVVARRVLLRSALGVLIVVAAHGLRDRIRDSLVSDAALWAEVRELSPARERDRIAADLGESVVRRILEAGLRLQGAAAMIGEGPAQRRKLLEGVAEPDGVIRSLRESVFGLEYEADSEASASERPESDAR